MLELKENMKCDQIYMIIKIMRLYNACIQEFSSMFE